MKTLDLVSVDLKLLWRTSNYTVSIPAALGFTYLLVHSLKVDQRLVYIFFVQLGLGHIYTSIFTRTRYEFLIYSLVPVSEGSLLVAKNLSCLIFASGPVFSVITILEALSYPARGLVMITLLDFVFSFFVIATAGNIISARRARFSRSSFSILGYMFQLAVVGCGAVIYWLCGRVFHPLLGVLVSLSIAVLGYVLSCSLTLVMIKGVRKGYMDAL